MFTLIVVKFVRIYYKFDKGELVDEEEGLEHYFMAMQENHKKWMLVEEVNAREKIGGMSMMFDDCWTEL